MKNPLIAHLLGLEVPMHRRISAGRLAAAFPVLVSLAVGPVVVFALAIGSASSAWGANADEPAPLKKVEIKPAKRSSLESRQKPRPRKPAAEKPAAEKPPAGKGRVAGPRPKGKELEPAPKNKKDVGERAAAEKPAREKVVDERPPEEKGGGGGIARSKGGQRERLGLALPLHDPAIRGHLPWASLSTRSRWW